MASATPTLPVTRSSWPSTRNGRSKQATTCSAAHRGSTSSGSRTANSSPLRRPTVAPAGDGLQQPGRQLAQQLVARGVAADVVDLLEAVEVAEQDRTAGTGAERLLEPVGEQHPVGQPGEGVVQRLVAHRRQQPGALQRGRRLVGHPAQAQRQVLAQCGRDLAVPAGRGHAEQVLADQQRRAGQGVHAECGHRGGERRAGVGRVQAHRPALGDHGDQLGDVLGAQDRGSARRRAVGRRDRHQLAGDRVPEHDRAAVAAHRGRQGRRDEPGDLVRVGRPGQLVRELEQGPGAGAVAPAVLEGAEEVEGGGGVAGVGREQPALVAQADLPLAVEGGQPAVVAAGRGDVDDDGVRPEVLARPAAGRSSSRALRPAGPWTAPAAGRRRPGGPRAGSRGPGRSRPPAR